MNNAMSIPDAVNFITPDEYLTGEQLRSIRHEYIAGQVFAVAGASEKHSRISLNLAFHLRAATRGTQCGVFINDMKVHIATREIFYYPDVILTCDADDREPFYKTTPCFIAEVLSPSTELTDRREKLANYRALPSLRYYLLISQEQQMVELYQRSDADQWHYSYYENTGELYLECPPVQLHFMVDDLYEDVVMS
jgi:Uma2 family endonuclease